MCSRNAAVSLKFNALVDYPAHVVWLNVTEGMRKNVVDHVYTLLGFLLVETAEIRVEDGDRGADESGFWYGITSSHVVSLREPIPQTF